MYTTNFYSSSNPVLGKAQQAWHGFRQWLGMDFENKGRLVFIAVLVTALLAFEVFNFSTTEYALQDLLGTATFFGIGWATTLAVAFCVIDFAGLSRLFTPTETRTQSLEVWYLLGAWFLGATLNAAMTWWAISLAMMNSQTLGNELFSRSQLLTYVPFFIASLVWLTRMLIIGSFRMAADQIYVQAGNRFATTRFNSSFSRPTIRTVDTNTYRLPNMTARALPAGHNAVTGRRQLRQPAPYRQPAAPRQWTTAHVPSNTSTPTGAVARAAPAAGNERPARVSTATTTTGRLSQPAKRSSKTPRKSASSQRRRPRKTQQAARPVRPAPKPSQQRTPPQQAEQTTFGELVYEDID